jgi:hypothetical protein
MRGHTEPFNNVVTGLQDTLLHGGKTECREVKKERERDAHEENEERKWGTHSLALTRPD